MSIDRREVVAEILKSRENSLVIAGLGASAWDITAAGDCKLNFPLWGGMGGSITVGLGLAIAQPNRQILVFTGDGEILMGLGSLATVAVVSPPNLSIVVLDNEEYGETGKQKTHTAFDTDLAGVAKACGIKRVSQINSADLTDSFKDDVYRGTGIFFGVIKVSNDSHKLILPPRSGATLTRRFREELLGSS